jgi:hypothetical protein
MDMATMVGLFAATPPSTRFPSVRAAVRLEVVRREVGRRRRRADADVGVGVLERLVPGLERGEDDRLQVLDVERRDDHIGHRARDLHVVGEALDLLAEEGAVLFRPHHRAGNSFHEPAGSITATTTSKCSNLFFQKKKPKKRRTYFLWGKILRLKQWASLK